MDVSDIITTEKQTRRFNAHLWATPEHNLIPATGTPNLLSLYEPNLGTLEPEPSRKHVYVILCNLAATAAAPTREPLPTSLETYCHISPTEVLLNFGPLSREATSWHNVLFEQHSEAPQTVAQEVSASQRRVDRLVGIQAALGFPVQVLAAVLRISRPALYKWLDLEDDVQPHADNHERLTAVERIADEWRARSASPLSSFAYESLANGQTIIDMLTTDVLDVTHIVGALDELISKLQAKPKSLSQKMMDAGYKRRPSRRSLSDDE
jgi:hypothetical protein